MTVLRCWCWSEMKTSSALFLCMRVSLVVRMREKVWALVSVVVEERSVCSFRWTLLSRKNKTAAKRRHTELMVLRMPHKFTARRLWVPQFMCPIPRCACCRALPRVWLAAYISKERETWDVLKFRSTALEISFCWNFCYHPPPSLALPVQRIRAESASRRTGAAVCSTAEQWVEIFILSSHKILRRMAWKDEIEAFFMCWH